MNKKEDIITSLSNFIDYFLKEKRTKEIFNDFFKFFIIDELGSIIMCESPIEKMMFIALKRVLPDNYEFTPQVKVGEFRVDFIIRVYEEDEKIFTTVVECDGYNYHERTKEQAKRDKSRERKLYRKNIDLILRFTGSEIYNQPFKCAEEVYGSIQYRIKRCDYNGTS